MTNVWLRQSIYPIGNLYFLFLLTFQIKSFLAADVEYPGETASQIAFGSCHKIKDVNASKGIIWDAISKVNVNGTKPDAFIWTGDSIYPTEKGTASVRNMISSYRQMHNDPKIGYKSFISSPPLRLGVHGTWDDHDFGGNDRGKEMPDQTERRKAYFDFLQIPQEDPRRTDNENKGRVYGSVSFGDAPKKVLVLLLDTRSYRDRHCIPSPAAVPHLPLSAIWGCLFRWIAAGFDLIKQIKHCHEGEMLGEAQWEWLEKELEKSDAQAHIIVSSVQILTTNPLVESWCHFNKERQRLLRLISQSNIPGVIFLSGDVHFSEILSTNPEFLREHYNGRNHPLLEVTSSGLTHSCESAFYSFLCKPVLHSFPDHRYRRKREKHHNFYYTNRNFGTIDIDWNDENDSIGSINVNVHDHLGKIQISTGKIGLSTPLSLTEEEIMNIAECDDGHLIPIAKHFSYFFIVFPLCLALFYWNMNSVEFNKKTFNTAYKHNRHTRKKKRV